MLFDLSGLYKKIKCNGSVNKLPNGITLIAENVPDYELVNGYIDLNVGSAYETPEKKGIMHFLEHLCATHDMNKELGLMGVKIDAITSPLNISFPIKGSDNFLLKDNFVKAFKIIKNDLFKPSFNHEVIESERLTVKKEIIERNNKFNPYRDIIDSINNYLYGNNPLFKDNAITGSKESVDSITIDNLIDFHNKFFVGSNTIVGLIGDLGPNFELRDEIIKELSDILKGSLSELISYVPERLFNKNKFLSFNNPQKSSDCNIKIYYQIPINPVDISKINILMNILGNGFNSLLFKELREKERLIYGLSTKLEGHYITNYLKIEYNVDKSKKDFSIACVNNCINKLKSGDFDKDLIDIFKARELPGLIVDVKKVGTIHDYLKIENMGNINTKK